MFSDMMAPTEATFDNKLGAMFTNVSSWFTFTSVFTDDTSVAADAFDAVPIALPAIANQQTMSIELTVGAPQLETLADTVAENSEHRGTYFGAQGTYRCETTGGCGIRRATGGATPFGVSLLTTANPDLTSPNWVFKPDAGETIMVPDQDWVMYGAWLTTPDVGAGTHRLGVFYNGMDMYDAANSVFATPGTTNNSLHGKATYSGGAAGVYVDGDEESGMFESGMFTASASLTVNFDVDGDGRDDSGDMTMSGRIDNFMDTAGNYLGTDTMDMPNDPNAGGENDWVIMIPSTDLADTTSTYAGTNATGSADGVPWMATQWNAQFYGAGDTASDAAAPTGVAGSFRAVTDNIGTSAAPMYKGVVGAFGAN